MIQICSNTYNITNFYNKIHRLLEDNMNHKLIRIHLHNPISIIFYLQSGSLNKINDKLCSITNILSRIPKILLLVFLLHNLDLPYFFLYSSYQSINIFVIQSNQSLIHQTIVYIHLKRLKLHFTYSFNEDFML